MTTTYLVRFQANRDPVSVCARFVTVEDGEDATVDILREHPNGKILTVDRRSLVARGGSL